MHQQPQGQSIWGTINTCIEIALDVYAIIAKDRDTPNQSGNRIQSFPVKVVVHCPQLYKPGMEDGKFCFIKQFPCIHQPNGGGKWFLAVGLPV